jgi:hypothetical protein
MARRAQLLITGLAVYRNAPLHSIPCDYCREPLDSADDFDSSVLVIDQLISGEEGHEHLWLHAPCASRLAAELVRCVVGTADEENE